ncbi:hypothetical protein WOLCODRAFT_139859 [Wolfiporia cocos MD-104 SS10]|uniref:G-patch domain-containing protein n=1 Tax=Wolfiporia cocos (strain MD-104) TaxID=742152 RepID=A0A2H3IZA9_WOLCO|nr:hypothetical protein WOLCODRAFT_139859 [Wolfiporia cocos MD-104 SS10]
MSTGKVSFTIRRPSSVSRGTSSGADSDSSLKLPALPRHLADPSSSTPGSPLARSANASPKPAARTYDERDSSDEDDEDGADELVTGFDQFGVQRLHEKRKEPQGPLVIPALKNKDWRELARKRKSLYVPPSAAAETGADGSVGGLGTRDSINSGPQLVGLQVHKRVKLEGDSSDAVISEGAAVEADAVAADVKEEEETEDQKALRAILASANSDDPMGLSAPAIAAIPTPSEDDAYKQDVEELPESATLADYERVPVSQFGAALLRGMGWKEGTAASRKQKGSVEPYLPQARPALLGIGAKEKEVFDDGSKMGKKGGKGKPDRRYVPVIKKERPRGQEEDGRSERSGERSESRTVSTKRRSPDPERKSSRRHSRSPEPERKRDRDRDRERDGDYDKDRRRDGRRGYESSRRGDREYDRDRRRDRSPDRYDTDGRRRNQDRGY